MERPGKSEGGKEKRGYPAREVRQRVRREGAPRRRLEQRTKKNISLSKQFRDVLSEGEIHCLRRLRREGSPERLSRS